jgi:hypothetical protein
VGRLLASLICIDKTARQLYFPTPGTVSELTKKNDPPITQDRQHNDSTYRPAGGGMKREVPTALATRKQNGVITHFKKFVAKHPGVFVP